MAAATDVHALIIRRTRRVPVPAFPAGDVNADLACKILTRLDAALLTAGWKMSAGLLQALSVRDPNDLLDLASAVLGAVRAETGSAVEHNVYFRDFPLNVPDTADFWARCLIEASLAPAEMWAEAGELGVHIMDVSRYGRYQHQFDDMVAAHQAFMPGNGDRVTVLHEGGDLGAEVNAVYRLLAESAVPLADDDQAALADLALLCAADETQPARIPVREHLAVINHARIAAKHPLLPCRPTDVLRLAAVMSGQHPGLRARTRFRSFTRPERRILLAALDAAAATDLAQIPAYAGLWVRLGERLHPGEHPAWPVARTVFTAARTGAVPVRPDTAIARACMAAGDPARAAAALRRNPGMMWRSLDWLLREAHKDGCAGEVIADAARCAPQVSGRVLLSVREHLATRTSTYAPPRVFPTRRGRAWVTPETRPPLPLGVAAQMIDAIDAEVRSRMPDPGHLVIDPAVRSVAVPLARGQFTGLGVMPRGSVSKIGTPPYPGDTLRLFLHWMQAAHRTDYDLSVLFLGRDWATADKVSYTNLQASTPGTTGRDDWAVHSGDLTDAPPPGGASEFVNIRLAECPYGYIIPQVNQFGGEPFGTTAVGFTGYMTLDEQQAGLPFEPRAVRTRSDLGADLGNVAMPALFYRGDDGAWYCKWMHLYLAGRDQFNRIENNAMSASLMAAGILARNYLRVGDLLTMLSSRAQVVSTLLDGVVPVTLKHEKRPVTYVGLEQPEGLPDGATVITLASLHQLVPA